MAYLTCERISYWAKTKLALFMLTAFVVAGCGGGGDGNCSYLAKECPAQVKINAFNVYGNDAPVNGREQIVAGINNGKFRMGVNVDNVWSDDARVWVSDKSDLGATNLEKEISHVKCGYYPFCTFNYTEDCSFSATNMVSCGSGGADISALLSGSQGNLFIVLQVIANAAIPAEIVVPVTFRYN
jgi:hypothetical protein